MFQKRTDLAEEARELWRESAGETTKLAGVKAREHRREGCAVTRVDILDGTGAEALGKPVGRYVTLDFRPLRPRGDGFSRAVTALGEELRELLPEEGTVLVAGLGNRAMTPDALGPLALEHLLVTRHLRAAMPREFSGFRSVAACAADVLGRTGVESAETVEALAERVHPAAVIVIDALASRRTERLCATVQLSDSGIVPGSGVGNHRHPLNRETLGVPVIAVGVPTVVDGATLAADLLEEAGITDFDEARLRQRSGSITVTPRDIDQQVREMAKVIGYGLNHALQGLEIGEITALLE